MYRYTTPTLPIRIKDLDFSEVALFRIKIKRGEKSMLFVVDADDSCVDAEHNMIYLALTQEQTSELKEGRAWIQARIKYTSGAVQATPRASVTINDVLDEEII